VISESPSHRPSASRGARPDTLTLLGGFELRRRDEQIPLPLGCQRVVAFLALHRRPLTRVYVAGMLWIDVSEARSCGNLRSALWRIRQRCGALVQTTPTHLLLTRELIVDVDTVFASTRRVLGDNAVCEAELDEACAPGELLPDWYDDWLEPERERLRQLRLHALEAAAERLLESGRAPHAIDALLVALRDEPLRESLHRLLIRAHLVEGNATEAIRCYRAYRRRLNTTLGLAPSPRMDAVVGGLLAVR
jgi:DNA-binding SARP family transcriptional activator